MKIIFKSTCYVILLIASICLTNMALAQGPSLAWAQGLGGSGDDYAHFVAVDDFNNVYTAGGFKGAIDFDFGSGIWNMTPSGTEDAFVTKADASGNLIWAIQMGGNSETHARSVEVDSDGNVYVTGYLYETADFDPGVGVSMITSQGERDIFVLKLDSNGGFIWVKSFGETGTDIGYIVLPDPFGNVYVTGAFMSTVDFDPGAATYGLSSNGHLDVFICKLDSDGGLLWAKSYGSSEWDNGMRIGIDSNDNIYLSGFFKGTVDFLSGIGTDYYTSAGGHDMCISKYSAEGDYLWTKIMGSTEDDYGFFVVSPSDALAGTGHFKGNVDFDPNAGEYMLNSLGEQDIFVATYDLDGNLIWAKSIGSSGVDAGQTAVGDNEGNVYLTGLFEATLDFDASGNTAELTSNGGYDAFISKYDAEGSYEWAVSFGGATDDYPYALDIALSGEVFSAGWVGGNLDFDFGSGVSDYINIGGKDIYLLKLTQPLCAPVYFEQSLILCKGQQIEVGSSTYNDAGIYIDVLIAINGCDSIVTTTIEDGADIITDTDIGGTTIIALQDNANYQWLDCEDDYTPMLNAINQAFNPTQTGYYAVEITIGSCSDTSTCVYVIIDNISQLMDFENILIYPNPSSGILNFESRTEAELELMNAIGEVVFSKKMNSGVKQLDFAYLASGLYYVNLRSLTQRKSFNWLKE